MSPPKINVDPDELKRCLQRMGHISRDMDDTADNMFTIVKAANEFWDDRKYKEFVKRITDERRHVHLFTKKLDHFTKYLGKKANKMDVYLNTR